MGGSLPAPLLVYYDSLDAENLVSLIGVSMLMGVFFLSNAVANYLGGILAAQTENIATQGAFFSIPVVTSWGAALLMLALVPLLKRLTASAKV